MNEMYVALIRYGIDLLRQRLVGTAGPRPTGRIADLAYTVTIGEEVSARLDRVCQLVGDVPDRPPTGDRTNLVSIFCSIKDRNEQVLPLHHLPQRCLSPDLTQTKEEKPAIMWQNFCKELSLVPVGDGAFETFCAVMCKYGWYVPGTIFAKDISVFEQFKAVVALAWCMPEENKDQVLLLAGDIPGIQKILYTITSKGAAKSLRGRSFYLQLLNDAVVRAILRELRLPSACVVYNAGGNFKLIARVSDREEVEALYKELNRRLLALHRGEMCLALAWTSISADDILDPGEFPKTLRTLADKLQTVKRQAFAPLGVEAYEQVFALTGTGTGKRCDICQAELPENKQSDDKKICRQCASFENLARKIAGTEMSPWLAVKETARLLKEIALPTSYPSNQPTWEETLSALGSNYVIGDEATNDAVTFTSRYLLNDTHGFIPASPRAKCRYGFRFLANVTPRVRLQEISRLQSCLRDFEECNRLREGQIRDTTMMAECDAMGIHHYGVLRMDVDDLGMVFSSRLSIPDALHVSGLSAHLALFFEGWLNQLCHQCVAEWGERISELIGESQAAEHDKTPYVLYAGGDDLFVVGPWDILPQLARAVQRDLGSYVNLGFIDRKMNVQDGPLTVSAGVYADSSKFPLYQAANLAKSSLSAAKRRTTYEKHKGELRREVVKDAFSWMGITLGWQDFQHAMDLALKLANLVKVGKNNYTAPSSLLWLLHDVAIDYKQRKTCHSTDCISYGPWMWKLAYGLKRLKDRLKSVDAELAGKVISIAGDTLDLTRARDSVQWRTIEFLDLSVRWAELLIREEGQQCKSAKRDRSPANQLAVE